MPIALNHYTDGELVTLAENLLNAVNKPIMEAIPKVAPWVKDLERDLLTFKKTSSLPVPPPPQPAPEVPDAASLTLAEIDDRVDDTTRTLESLLDGSIKQARSLGDFALATRLTIVKDSIFDHGLSIINTNRLVQPGAISRLIELARREDTRDDLAPLSLNAEPFPQIVDRLEDLNTRMIRLVAPQNPTAPPQQTTAHALRLRLVSRLNRVFENLEFAISDKDIPDGLNTDSLLTMRHSIGANVAERRRT